MNKFDRTLWRINGVLFLVILIFTVWFVAGDAAHSFFRRSRPPKDATIVKEAQGTHEKEFLNLGDAVRIKGMPFLRMPLRDEPPSAGASSSFKSGGTRIRNYLFLNHSDLSSWWLFPRFDWVISHVHDLRAEAGGNDKNVISTLYEVISADTDGDGRLTANDREAVFFTGPDGKKPVEIVSSTDGILSLEQVTPVEVLIIYQRDESVTAAVFSVQDGSKIREAPLPIKEAK
jgi:hypothetical protein